MMPEVMPMNRENLRKVKLRIMIDDIDGWLIRLGLGEVDKDTATVLLADIRQQLRCMEILDE